MSAEFTVTIYALVCVASVVSLSSCGGGPGTTCTIVDNGDGSKTIQCSDGTSVSVDDVNASGDGGVPARQWVVRLEPEPTGENCVLGGTAILTGPDENSNGMLDLPGELRTTAYVCGGAPNPPCTSLQGDLTIRNSLDWTSFIRSGCSSINGTLTITAPNLVALDPAPIGLTAVGGLVVTGNTTLTGLTFPALTTIDGDVFIASNTSTTMSLNFPALTSVSGSFAVGPGTATQSGVATLSMPLLATVGALSLGKLGATMLTFPALTTVAALSIQANPNLTSINFPALTNVGRDLTVADNPVLPIASFPALTTLGPNGDPANETYFYFIANAALTSISAPVLANGVQNLWIRNHPTLTSVVLPMLASVSTEVLIQNNSALRQCLVDALDVQITSGPSTYTVSGNSGAPNTCP